MAQTVFEKIWSSHVVGQLDDGIDLLYIDLHLVHDVTSVQAFHSLEERGRRVRRPDLTFGLQDHSVPTEPDVVRGRRPIEDKAARQLLDAFKDACRRSGVPMRTMGSSENGIVHVVGPELGLSLPGMTIVCGDSHTSTHGAVGALAFGIGTSEVEQVLATQTLLQRRPKPMSVEVSGSLPRGVGAKDLILSIIKRIGVDGGNGHVIEYRGEAVRTLSVEDRMTVCNMSIEGGARAGLIAPDEKTIQYVSSRRFAPKGADLLEAVAAWEDLATDDDAEFAKSVSIDASEVEPIVTWGTNPSQSSPVSGRVPTLDSFPTEEAAEKANYALQYMGLAGGEAVEDIAIDAVFIGSCTNSRLDDLRRAAEILKGRKLARGVRGIVVPGSALVKRAAEAEGLHEIFRKAGFEWRESGCSMCGAMNGDYLKPKERCATTSNRNFEGRQGPGSRSHLVSPEMAAAAGVFGHFVDVRALI